MGKVNNSPLKNSGLERVCAERRIIGIGVLLLFLASNAQLVYATEESYTLESSHPYSNNYDNTWTITKTGAAKIRVHFTKIETESGYDYVYVYDGSDAELAKYDGTHTDKWSPWASGNKIKIRLTTDSSVTKWGFKIDKIEYEVAAGDSWDPTDDTASSGTSITPTTSSQQHGPHSLSSSDNYDWFRISMTAGRTYYFSGSWGSYSDTYAELYSDSGGSNRVAYDDDSVGSWQFSFSYTAANTQTYYLRIRCYSVGSNCNYYLNYYYTETQNDAGSGGDAGNSFSDALSISPGSFAGTITSTDTEDWYKFEVTQGQRIEVSMTPPSGVDFDLKLYDSNGNEKASSTLGSGQTDSVTYTADTSGTLYWRFKIYQYSGTGQYSFSLSLITVVDEYPAISVDASPGAESYNDGTYDWFNAWYVDWQKPTQVFKPGEKMRVKANVRNIGAGSASNVQVEFRENSAIGTLIGTTTITSIAAGVSALTSIEWTVKAGVSQVCVNVDPDNLIAEVSEGNNRACKSTTKVLDRDGDGLTDYEETNGMRLEFPKPYVKTDPSKWDSDGDGLSDGWEMGEVVYDAANKLTYDLLRVIYGWPAYDASTTSTRPIRLKLTRISSASL